MTSQLAPHISRRRASPALDVESLYRSLSLRLERIVRRDVAVAEPVVEDACQFAWGKLVSHATVVRRESVLTWLAQTAIHEALRLARRDAREPCVADGAVVLPEREPDPQEVAAQRARIEDIAQLPARQQRVVWLQALGLSYSEIAMLSGCTVRTVERQLLRARRRLREIAAEE